MKNYKVRVTKQATEHLQSIRRDIAVNHFAPNAAKEFLATLKKEIKSLAQFPERIKLVDDEPWRSEGYRRKVVKSYYIYFWIDEDNNRVQVTAIVYTGRNQRMQMDMMEKE